MDFKLTAEQEKLRKSLSEFCAAEIGPRAAEVDEKAEFPAENWKKLAEQGVMALTVPEQYGGAGKDLATALTAISVIAEHCASTAEAVATSMLCAGKAIEIYGSEQLKGRILPKLAKGCEIGALAVSEPGAGSDVSAIKTTAEKCGEEYILKGEKAYVTNAPVADGIVTLTKTGDSFTVFAAPKFAAGICVGAPARTLGMRGAVAANISFNEVNLGDNNILGGYGNGLAVIADIFDYVRLNVCAVANGISVAAYNVAKSHAETRESFGKPLAAHQIVAFRVTDMYVDADVSRMLMYNAAWKKQNGEKCAPFVALAKVSASDTAIKNSDRCMKVLASAGLSADSPAQRIYRDARLMEIAGGTNDILRQIIARDQLEL